MDRTITLSRGRGSMEKNVLITGSSSGFGMYSALELAKCGYTIYASMRNVEKQTQLMEEAERYQAQERIHILQMDITDEKSVQQALDFFKKQNIHLHILINNAGYCEGGLIEDLHVEDYIRQFETNVFGAIRVTQTFLPLLKKGVGAKIINISSVSGMIGMPGMSAYCSSKFALEGFSESLRLELRQDQIDVSIVQPASFKTKIWEKGLENFQIDRESSLIGSIYKYANQSYQNGDDPLKVARLIVQICNSRHPKLRYPIGKGAKTLEVSKKVFPWKWIEKVVHNRLK